MIKVRDMGKEYLFIRKVKEFMKVIGLMIREKELGMSDLVT